MRAIDTNILVRYLTRDDPDQALRARRLIEANRIFVPVTVILETEWVLRNAYGFPFLDVAHALRNFCGLENVKIESAELVFRALADADAGMDFADALHLSQATHCEEFCTFDRKLIRRALAAGYDRVREP